MRGESAFGRAARVTLALALATGLAPAALALAAEPSFSWADDVPAMPLPGESADQEPSDALVNDFSTLPAEPETALDPAIESFAIDDELPAPTGDVPDARSAFNLRDEGLVTPVRDQGSTDICWAFASLAALESSVLRQGGPSLELSPYQAAYFAVMGDEEREASGMNPFMPDDPYKGGVTPFRLTGSLAAGKGAALVQEGITDGPNGLDESLRYASDVRLTETAFLDGKAGAYWEVPAADALQASAKEVIEEQGLSLIHI